MSQHITDIVTLMHTSVRVLVCAIVLAFEYCYYVRGDPLYVKLALYLVIAGYILDVLIRRIELKHLLHSQLCTHFRSIIEGRKYKVHNCSSLICPKGNLEEYIYAAKTGMELPAPQLQHLKIPNLTEELLRVVGYHMTYDRGNCKVVNDIISSAMCCIGSRTLPLCEHLKGIQPELKEYSEGEVTKLCYAIQQSDPSNELACTGKNCVRRTMKLVKYMTGETSLKLWDKQAITSELKSLEPGIHTAGVYEPETDSYILITTSQRSLHKLAEVYLNSIDTL